MKRKFLRAAVIVLVLAGLAVLVSVSGANLTDDDPLISLSYLAGKFRTEILGEVQKTAQTAADSMLRQAEKRADKLTVTAQKQTVEATHKTVELAADEVYELAAGDEVLLLSGRAWAEGNGLTDTTEGAAVAPEGELTVNHLCLATLSVRLHAAENASLLVSQ